MTARQIEDRAVGVALAATVRLDRQCSHELNERDAVGFSNSLSALRLEQHVGTLNVPQPRYDSLALSLAVIPLVIFYLTFVTAPAALYIAVRYWNAPRSIVHRSKIRLVLAIIIASLQIVGWGIAIYFIVAKSHG